jgi:hypothetical protein
MADQVRPVVRMLIPCENAIVVLDEETDLWQYVLTAPWSIVMLPQNTSFPFRPVQMSLYAQLVQGVGEFDIHAEMRRVRLNIDGTLSAIEKVLGRSASLQVTCSENERLLVTEVAFDFSGAPFGQTGVYEFRLMANYAELPGVRALLNVVEGSAKL